jgi:uncharacterized phage protein (TIGR01671 family)
MEQREIKFRVWNSAKQEWVKPIYEAYKGNLYDVSISLGGQIIERTLKCCSDIRNTNDFIISQYTGLKDKNGKEIYEGDIMGWESYEGTKNQIRWVVEFSPLRGYKSWSSSKNDEIVIGNIYEGKHLIN